MRTELNECKETSPSLLEKMSFGLGDFSGNGIFTFVATYLMFFYTDVAKLDLKDIGIILLIGRSVDAIFSPVMGIIVDKVNTRYGKCRPFIGAAILPICLLMCALFYVPESLNGWGKSIYGAVIYVLFSLLYAFMNVPYSTLLTMVTHSPDERISFNLFKNVGANMGGIFVTACTLGLVSKLGGTQSSGFFRTAAVFAIIFLFCSLTCVKYVRERVRIEKNAGQGIVDAIKTAKLNNHWIILCCVQFLSLTYMMVRNQGTLYYAKYYLGQEWVGSLFLSIMPLASIGVAFILPVIAKKRGMRFCVGAGNGLWCLAMVGTYLAGKQIIAVVLFHIIASVGWAMATGMVFVMLSQVIDYSQWQTGNRPQGFLTSMIALVQKLGVACSGYICTVVLRLGGYEAGEKIEEGTAHAIRMNFAGIPFLLSMAVIVLISFYTLDKQYPDIAKELKNNLK